MPNDLKALARDLRRTRTALVDATNSATAKVAIAVKIKAVAHSSGTMTAADQRAKDHPYARRHGSPLADPSTINVGKGLFRASWAVESRPGPDGIAVRTVVNRSKVAGYLMPGTRTMFARPLDAILRATAEETWNRVAPELYETALRNALQR